MRSLKFKLLGILFVLPFALLVPTTAKASNFAGVKVIVQNTADTRLDNIQVDLRAATSGTYSGGGVSRSCTSGVGTNGPFVNLQGGNNPYYGDISGFKTGGAYNYGGYYDNASGEIYFGNGVNSASNGGGNGFGFACSCNPLIIKVHVPAGYYSDYNDNGKYDHGEVVGPNIFTYTSGSLSNDSTSTFTFHLGNMPTVSVDLAFSSSNPKIGDTVTATLSLTKTGGDAMGTAFIRDNLENNGNTSPHYGTAANPNSVSDVMEALDYSVPDNGYAAYIHPTVYSGTYGFQWQFTTGSSTAIYAGTWVEKYTFRIRNDRSLDGKVVGGGMGGGVYPNGSVWALSPVRTFTITAPPLATTATLITAIDPPAAATAAAPQIIDTTIGGGADPIRYASYSMTAAQKANYAFKNWTSDHPNGIPVDCVNDGAPPIVNGKIQIGRGSTYTVTCTAHFTPKPVLGIRVYKNDGTGYVWSNEGGNVTTSDGINCPDGNPAVCSKTYEVNGYTDITATADSGYTFDHWVFSWIDSNGVMQYHRVEADFNASFSNAGSEGSLPNVGSGGHTYNPHGAYMDRNWIASAFFKRSAYPITPSVDAGCNINPNIVQLVNIGASSVPFTGSASANYRFDGFSVDSGATIAKNAYVSGTKDSTNSYTFTNVQASHTIKAKCTYIPPNDAPTIHLDLPPYWSDLSDPHEGEFPPGSVNLSATARDANGDGVDLEIRYQRAGDGVNWTIPASCNITNVFNSQPWSRTCVTPSLLDGDYWWTARAKDEHGTLSSWAAPRLFKIVTPIPAPTLTCSILPTGGGQAPLVVQVSYSVTNPTGSDVSINMGDGNSFNKPGGAAAPGSVFNSTPFYYTYKEASTYNATFSLLGSAATCNQTARVIDPNAGSGGEVSP